MKEELEKHFESHLEDYLDMLRQMVEINSFTTNRNGVNKLGDLTEKIFSRLGFQTERIPSSNPEYGNHLVLTRPAVVGEEHSSLGFITHLDTVFPEDEEIQNNFSWRVEANRIFGPATVDIKGGTVLIYMILEAIHRLNPNLYDSTNWYVLANAAEEMLDPSFAKVCLEHLPADASAALVFEGGKVDGRQFSLVTARKGRVGYRISVEGKAAHAGSAHQYGANAIIRLAQLVEEISSRTDYDKDITYNIGHISGGTVPNRVPHLAAASGEMRAFDPELIVEAKIRLKALEEMQDIPGSNGTYPFPVKVDIHSSWRPWPKNEMTETLFSIWEQAAEDLGWQTMAEQRGGLSDGNWIWDFIPTIDGLGPSGGNAHCSERSEDGSKEQEFVDVTSFVPKAILNTTAIVNLLTKQA